MSSALASARPFGLRLGDGRAPVRPRLAPASARLPAPSYRAARAPAPRAVPDAGADAADAAPGGAAAPEGAEGACGDPAAEGCFQEEDGSVVVRDDLESLLAALPPDLRAPLAAHPRRAALLEVVLDLGRRPEARFLGGRGGEPLREAPVTPDDLAHAAAALGDFGGDNRAGIEGTLHRVSAIRSRRGAVVGLTCRVGRAVTGHIDMIRDILDTAPTGAAPPPSILFLGRPGVGKTTVIREMARVLADDLRRRVVIVDTSNEIGGDGDVPHPAIGGARRMQVPDPAAQHRVMIEAVENHMPEVVIVDEIGTEAEALACRTIAERGVQLVGTAHGQTLANLMMNPTLSDLVGGIASVTLGDEEARARGTQKSVLERKAPPTFPLVIEMRERAHWVAHWTEDSVDALLAGRAPGVQVRRRDAATRRVVVEELRYDAADPPAASGGGSGGSGGSSASVAAGLGNISASSGAYSANSNNGSYNNSANGGVPDGITSSVFDSMFYGAEPGGRAMGLGTGGPGAPSPGDGDPYAWAARLRDVPEEAALAEMAALGFTDGGRRGYDFSGAGGGGGGGGGAGGKKKRRLRAVSGGGRGAAPPARRR